MKKIAVIGAGISGLSAAYYLKNDYDITLFEQYSQLGGHAHTVDVDEQGKSFPVDVGFIVFNYETYHYLTQLFNDLDVPVAKSSMSFGVSINKGAIEYGSGPFNHIFAQRRNIFRPSYWKMLFDIKKFNSVSMKHLENKTLPDLTLGEYIQRLGLGDWFTNYYILPMGAAIWSTPLASMLAFPAETFINFFNNHGLLRTKDPIQWYTVKGGSREYVNRLVDALNESGVSFGSKINSVERDSQGVTLTDSLGQSHRFDKVIFATHSDQVLSLLKSPTPEECDLIGVIGYRKNRIVLHKDTSFMPLNRRAWSSWVYFSDQRSSEQDSVSLTYWMNNLQSLPSKQNYFVTVNPGHEPAERDVIKSYDFDHPQFTRDAISAQAKIPSIQGQNNTYFCGAYLRYGFHEDGISSAVNVAKLLGVNPQW